MRGIIQVALAASLVAGAAAQPHQHQHRHLHAKKHERRDASGTVTSVVPGPTVVEYVLDNKKMDAQKAEKGISDGLYVVVGESTPSFSAPAPSSTSSAPNLASAAGAEFFEHKSSATPSPTPSSAPAPSPSAPSSSPSGGEGVDVPFPSGQVKCSAFPSKYGAIAVDWLNTGGWTSLQAPNKGYVKGTSISDITAGISGGCTKNTFCSYACPPGYQKTQWPNDQGSTGQSVGGLWCNDQGFLELTQPSSKTLCEQGAGGVYIQNKLSGSSAVCRTDYPASESMVIPLLTEPGQKYPLTNPSSKSYYQWQGKPTTAQYYVNNLDVAVEQACTWTSSLFPESAGNWAPVNIGVGEDALGTTYISIFPNLPTSNAKLDFNIKITGDVSSECALTGGSYTGGGKGCTVRRHFISFYSPLACALHFWVYFYALLTLLPQTAISKKGGTATIVLTH